jgi:hypothetical protein
MKWNIWAILLVMMDPKKIEAIKDWSRPKTLKILRGFLGLTSYYQKFIRNYGNIAAPLIASLKNNLSTGMTPQNKPSST